MDQSVNRKRDKFKSPDRSRKRQRQYSTDSRTTLTHNPSIHTALPFDAKQLTKHDLDEYTPLFTLYLDLQKHITANDLDEREFKGRWKSFVNKWNRGDLARGWYEPATLTGAHNAVRKDERNSHIKDRQTHNIQGGRDGTTGDSIASDHGQREGSEKNSSIDEEQTNTTANAADDEDEEFGPSLPPTHTTYPPANLSYHDTKPGPPTPQPADLQYQRAQAHDLRLEAQHHARETQKASLRAERKLAAQRLEELVPRAAPGTRERQLEKKHERAVLRDSAAAERDGEQEVGDAEVMGVDTAGEFQRLKTSEARKRSERETRREEVLKARRAEREERQKGIREKEERTMEMLSELARERFGAN